MPLAALLLTVEERVVWFNVPYRALFGLRPDEDFLGRPGPELRERVKAIFANPLTPDSPHITVSQVVPALRVPLVDGRTLERDAQQLPDGGWLVTYRDVTVEVQATRELASIARIPAQNPNPIFRLDADGKPLYLNPAAEQLRAVLNPDELLVTRQWVTATATEALLVGEPQRTSFPSGAQVFDAYVVPFPEEQYVSVYLTEVTARHEAEAAVQRQRAFYENLLDHLPAEVVVLDAELRYRYLTPRVVPDPDVRTWLVGRDDTAFFARLNRPPAGAEERRRQFALAFRERRQVQWEEVLPIPDGGYRYLARFAQPVFDAAGAPELLIGYGLDITPIRLAQLTQERSEKQYRDLMQYTQALICTHDLAGRVLTVNPAMTTLLGVPMEHLVGRLLTDLMPAADRPAVLAYLTQFANGDAATSSGVLRVQPRTAAKPHYLLYHNIRVTEAGQTPYIIGYAQDITERIRAERATKRAREAAEAAARARENFLASMSHEIRTPLNGVLGMAGLLAKTPLAPDQAQFVDLIQQAGRSLLVLLNDVLDMSKISSGKLEMAAVPFDLNETLRAVAQPLAVRAAEKGIRFRLDALPLPTAGVRSDPQRLGQVLTNLLGNAVKFTANGAITLSAKLRQQTDDTLAVTFLVQDTGIGISPQQQDQVFEEFTQAYTDTAVRFGGTGLGLAIAQRLVGRLGGQLQLSSALGEGTTFGFTLTLPRAELPLPVLPSATADGGISGLRVLLVEDNPVNRLLARLLLLHHGALVTEATTGVEAVACVRAEPFDVVLMDIQMPVMNGLQATAAIRALPDTTRATVPILALTANAFRSDTERYLAAGMDGCLTKPFEEAELVRVLAELADRAAPHPAPPSTEPLLSSSVTSPVVELGGTAAGVFPATALRLGHGNPAFVTTVVASFLAATPPLVAQLAGATPADAATVVALAHQLLPSARLFDAPDLAAALAELEMLAATDDPAWKDVRAYAVQELEDLLTQLHDWQAAG